MDKILVTCVVPVYNSEKYLKNTADSIFKQDFKDFEIIFVDNNSSDGSKEILQSFEKKKNVTVLYNERNLGASASRNKGLKLAKGEYLIFLDSDDYFEPCMISEAYKAAIENQADMVVWGAEWLELKIDEDGNEEIVESRYHIPQLEMVNGEITEKTIIDVNFVPWNKMVRRELLVNNHIFFQNIPTEDDVYYSMISMFCANTIVFVRKPLVKYIRGHYGSLTAKGKQEGDNYVAALEYTLKKIREKCPQYYDWFNEWALNFIYNKIMETDSEKEPKYRWRKLRESEWVLDLYENKATLSNRECAFVDAVQRDDYQAMKNKYGIYANQIRTFFQNAQGDGKSIALWGCGINGKKLLDLLDEMSISLDAVIDTDPGKQGQVYKKYTIQPYVPEERDYDYFIVPSRKFVEEISEIVGKDRVVSPENLPPVEKEVKGKKW